MSKIAFEVTKEIDGDYTYYTVDNWEEVDEQKLAGHMNILDDVFGNLLETLENLEILTGKKIRIEMEVLE